MQYNGLGTIALAFPELNDAADWYSHAESAVLADMLDGVYPDGVEDEQTASYHKVALNSFDGLFQTVFQSGQWPALQKYPI